MSLESFIIFQVFFFILGVYHILIGKLYVKGLRKIADPSLLIAYFIASLFLGKEKVAEHKKEFFSSDKVKSVGKWLIIGGIVMIVVIPLQIILLKMRGFL